MKNTGIKVKIFNSDYNLLGENIEEVEKFANYVDSIMQRINYQSPNTSAESIAVVSALNIAETYFREKDYRTSIEREHSKLLSDTISKLEEISASIDKVI